MINDDRDDHLLDLLTRIREIAALDDDVASEELLDLVQEIRAGGNWELEHARDVLVRIREEAQHSANVMDRGIPPESWWSARDFMTRVEELGRRWPLDVRKQLAGDIAETRHTVEPIARRASVYAVTFMIKDYLTRQFANTQERDRMLRDLGTAEETLTKLGEIDQHVSALRAARERLVRYRWSRRMEEAEVAQAGGNAKKAATLQGEARALLKQDWLRVFPSEVPPET